jgi:endoglucanase
LNPGRAAAITIDGHGLARDMPMMSTRRNADARKMKRLAFAFATSVSILPPNLVNACPTLTHTVSPDRIAALSRGFNVDGWINGPRSTPPAAGLLLELRKAGMTHVRLPVPAEHIMPRFASKEDRDDRLHAVDRALTELISLGYHVSIDLHPGDRFNRLHRQEPIASMHEMKDAWTALAHIIRSYPVDRVFAELLNEPDIDSDRWQVDAEELAAAVRQLLPRTTIIVGPVNWQRADSLPSFRPLNDLNVVYAVHFYDPMAFTHQGHWDPKEPLQSIRGLPYPIHADDPKVKELRQQLVDQNKTLSLEVLDQAIAGSRDKNGIDKWLEPAAAWQQQFSRPIIINEFGVLKASAPSESRLRWLSSVVTYAEQHCWGWAHWELAQGFGLVDDKTGKADSGVLRALLSRR